MKAFNFDQFSLFKRPSFDKSAHLIRHHHTKCPASSTSLLTTSSRPSASLPATAALLSDVQLAPRLPPPLVVFRRLLSLLVAAQPNPLLPKPRPLMERARLLSAIWYVRFYQKKRFYNISLTVFSAQGRLGAADQGMFPLKA